MSNLSGQLRLEQLEDSVALKVGRKYLGRIYGVKRVIFDKPTGHASMFDTRGLLVASLDKVAGLRPNGKSE